MLSQYVSLVATLTEQQKQQFYLIFARDLTIAQRVVWSDDTLTAVQQVEQLKWLNEVPHRIINRLYALVINRSQESEDDCWYLIQQHVHACPPIAEHIGQSFNIAYESIKQDSFPKGLADET